MRRILPYFCALGLLLLLAQATWAQDPFVVEVKGGRANGFLLYAHQKVGKVEWRKVSDGSTQEREYELSETIHTSQGDYKAAFIFLDEGEGERYQVTLPESKESYHNTFYGLRCRNEISIERWGSIHWVCLEEAFAGCNVTITASGRPYLATRSLRRMFAESTLNTNNLADWDVSGVEDFDGMFEGCTRFNGSLANWNVGSARTMRRMFAGATSFSQSLAPWGTQVQNLGRADDMFAGAVAYNESLAHWQLASCETLGIGGSGMSAANYAATLKGWATNPSIAKSVTLGASGLCYSDALEAHKKLIDTKQWHFVGDYSGEAIAAPGLKPFVTRWSPNFTGDLAIPVYGKNMTITWKDNTDGATGTIAGVTVSSPAECYSIRVTSGHTYEVSVAPEGVVAFRMKEMTHKASLASVEKWGDVAWQSMHAAFYGCPNVTFASNAGTPNLAAATDLSYMFAGCANFDTDISDWDVSNVTNMRAMFSGCRQFKSSLNEWGSKLAKVTDMGEMFDGCVLFNPTLSSWDVSAVRNMHAMFRGCEAFDQDLSSWWNKVVNVTDMSYLFAGCKVYNQSIDSWNTKSVTTMRSMFEGATLYNQPVGGWSVEQVEDMTDIFSHTAFNQPLGSWKLAKCRNLSFTDAKFEHSMYDQSLKGWSAKRNELVYGLKVSVSIYGISGISDEGIAAHHALEKENHWSFQEWYDMKPLYGNRKVYANPFQKKTVRVGEIFEFCFFYKGPQNEVHINPASGYFSLESKVFEIGEDSSVGKVMGRVKVLSKDGGSGDRRINYWFSSGEDLYWYYTILDTNEEPLDPKPVTLSAPSEVMVFEGKKTDVEIKVTTEATDKSVSVSVDGLQDPTVLARYAGGTSNGAKVEINGYAVGEYLVRAYSTHNPAAEPAVIRVRVVPAFSFTKLNDMTLKVGETSQPVLEVDGRLYSGALKWTVMPDEAAGGDLVDIAPNGAFTGKRVGAGTIRVSSLVQPAVPPTTAEITVTAAETGNALTLATPPAGVTFTHTPANITNLQAGTVVTIMVSAPEGKNYLATCPGATLKTLTENKVYQVTMGSAAATFTLVEAAEVTNPLILDVTGYEWKTTPEAIAALAPGTLVTLKITNPHNDRLTLTADNLEIVTVSPNRTYQLRMGNTPVTLKVTKYTEPTYTLTVNTGVTGLTYEADKTLTALHASDKVVVTLKNDEVLPVKHTVTAGVTCNVVEQYLKYEVTMPAGNVTLSFEELPNAELKVEMGELGLTYSTEPASLKHVLIGSTVTLRLQNSENIPLKCVHVETGNEVAATTKNKVFAFVMPAANATLRFERKSVHSLSIQGHIDDASDAFTHEPADLTELVSGDEVTFRLKGSGYVPSDSFPFFKITAGSAQLTSPETNVFKVTMGDDDATLLITWKDYLRVNFIDRGSRGMFYPSEAQVNGETRTLESDGNDRTLYRVKTGDVVVIEIRNNDNDDVDIDSNVPVETLVDDKRYQFVVGEGNVTFTMRKARFYSLDYGVNDGLGLEQETSFDLNRLRPGNEVIFRVTSNPDNHLVQAAITEGNAELTTLEENARYQVKMRASNVSFRVSKVFKTLFISTQHGSDVNMEVPVNSVVTFRPTLQNSYLESEDVTPELQSDGTYRFTMPNKNVTIYERRPLQLTIDNRTEGLEVTTDLDKENLRPGQTVRITVANPEGKRLLILSKKRGDNSVDVPYTTVTSDREYTIVMPAYDVYFGLEISKQNPVEVVNQTSLAYQANKPLAGLYTGDEVELTVNNPENADLLVAWEGGRELESIEANKRYKFTVTEGYAKIIIRLRPVFYTLTIDNPYDLSYRLRDSEGNLKNLERCEAEEKLTLRLSDAEDIVFKVTRSDNGDVTLVKGKTEEDAWTVFEFTMPASALTLKLDIAVSTVTINKPRLDIWIGRSEALTATVYPERLVERSVRWEVADNTIATVDIYGTVQGMAKGHTQVKAISKADESKFAVCDVYVDTPQALQSIAFSPENLKVGYGTSRPLQLVFNPKNFPDKGVTYSVKDENVCTVSSDGVVRGLAKGKTEVYAVSNVNVDIKATCVVEVIDAVPLKDIAFRKEHITLAVGATQKDLISFTPANASNQMVEWRIENNSIVSVDRFGELTALSIGETNVTAKSYELDKTITMKVTVTEFVRLESLSMAESTVKMKVGQTKNLLVNFKPANTTQRALTWESSNPKVVTVSAGYLTAVGEGTATIYATCKDANKTTQCAVTVEPAQPEAVEDAALSQVSIAPNPFEAQLRLRHEVLDGATYELLNTAGQSLRTGALTGAETVLETTDLPSGLYLLRVRLAGGASKTFRVVKR